VKLIIQPHDGIAPLLAAIKGARKSIEIVIFRFDQKEIETALEAAVGRGVLVHALIANTNRGGERNLRKLESRFLHAGVTVARSADDLIRYHGKILIVDRRVLYVLSFNFTHHDIDHRRGFGIVTKNAKSVQEAVKLFEADASRNTYSAGLDTFIVSPANARKQLASFISKAQKQLLIYDPKIADTEMLEVLHDRARAGVEVNIIGRLNRPSAVLTVRGPVQLQLHTRTIIRDRQQAFVGSQSLRQAELDSRREVGIIVHDAKVVGALLKIFESDWALIERARSQAEEKEAEETSRNKKVLKKAVKGLIKDLPPLAPIVKEVVKEVVENAGNQGLDHKEVQQTVKEAVREAVQKEEVQEAIKDAIKEVVRDSKDPD